MNAELKEYNAIYELHDGVYRQMAKLLGISSTELFIIYSLRMFARPCTQAEVCAELYLPKQTVNSAIKKLADEGKITLQGGAGRNKLIRLTEIGETFAASTADRLIHAEETALLRLSDDEREVFFSLYKKLAEFLDEETRKIAPIGASPEENTLAEV